MSVQDRLTWISRGSPFRLMQPAMDLRDVLRAYGYVVYDLGDRAHLEREPPEDHTPYSRTGYPGAAQYGVGYAIDIMPPSAASRLPSLQRLGAQLLADRNGGVRSISWLKYMNWEPTGNNTGPCWHESWQPLYVRRSSTDRGHIHLSGFTGLELSKIGAGYDPVARVTGVDTVALTSAQDGALSVSWQNADAWIDGQDITSGMPKPHWGVQETRRQTALLHEIRLLVGLLAGPRLGDGQLLTERLGSRLRTAILNELGDPADERVAAAVERGLCQVLAGLDDNDAAQR